MSASASSPRVVSRDMEWFTVCIYTRNQIGMLMTISSIFTRLGADIWSLTAIPTSTEGIRKITVETYTSRDGVEAITKQIERKIEVIKASYYEREL